MSYKEVAKRINKAVYDDYGQIIWGEQKNGHNEHVADLRGWGSIQQDFKNKDGSIDFKKAADFQDEIGRFIVEAINEKIEKELTKEQ